MNFSIRGHRAIIIMPYIFLINCLTHTNMFENKYQRYFSDKIRNKTQLEWLPIEGRSCKKVLE